jgi:hypothetical protein
MEAQYQAQGLPSDEVKRIDAERSAMTAERGQLYRDIQEGKREIPYFDPELGQGYTTQDFTPKQLAEKKKRFDELTRLIQANYEKSKELGTQQRVSPEVLQEWLTLRDNAYPNLRR